MLVGERRPPAENQLAKVSRRGQRTNPRQSNRQRCRSIGDLSEWLCLFDLQSQLEKQTLLAHPGREVNSHGETQIWIMAQWQRDSGGPDRVLKRRVGRPPRQSIDVILIGDVASQVLEGRRRVRDRRRHDDVSCPHVGVIGALKRTEPANRTGNPVEVHLGVVGQPARERGQAARIEGWIHDPFPTYSESARQECPVQDEVISEPLGEYVIGHVDLVAQGFEKRRSSVDGIGDRR